MRRVAVSVGLGLITSVIYQIWIKPKVDDALNASHAVDNGTAYPADLHDNTSGTV